MPSNTRNGKKDLKKTAFIQINPKDTLANINKDLKKLETLGYKYIFINEVTLLEDFIEGAALFSNIYVSKVFKILLSGTSSLGFMFTKVKSYMIGAYYYILRLSHIESLKKYLGLLG